MHIRGEKYRKKFEYAKNKNWSCKRIINLSFFINYTGSY